MASTAEERRKKLQAVIKRKEDAKREEKRKDRSNTSKSTGESKSKSSPSDKLKKTRGQRGLGDMSMGGRRDLGPGTGKAGVNDKTSEKATGSQVKVKKSVTNPLSGTKFHKYAGSSGARKSIRNARADYTNNALSISAKKDLLNQTDDHEKETSKGKPKKESKSFGQAFKEARSKGLKVFTWKGKKYTTKQKGE